MENTTTLLLFIGGILTTSLLVIFFMLSARGRQIKQSELAIMELYFNKINKLPALIEIMKQYTLHSDICTEMTRLHRATVIAGANSIYDILELNNRIHREFIFLMKVSAKIQNLHRNGNFLYIRDFLTFYEINIHKLISELNNEINRYNRLLIFKNYTIIGIFFPLSKKMTI